MASWILLISFLASPLLSVASASAALLVSPQPLVVGQSTTVTLTDGNGAPIVGALLVAIYRPGSQVSISEEIGFFPPTGYLTWRPHEAGLVRLQTGSPAGEVIVHDVAVRFRGTSTPGILVFLVAGSTLLGGAYFGLSYRGASPT